MTARWLAQTLRDAGLKVEEAPRWTVRGGAQFAPKGVMIHHTATGPNWSKERLTRLLTDGRPDLSGPLCHLQLERDGTFVVIAAGKANHAGSGRWNNITAGNTNFIGIECANDGVGEKWLQQQVEALGVGVAALLKVLQAPPGMVVGHKEWAPKRKIDPRGIDMDMFRRYVGNLAGTTISNNEVVRPMKVKSKNGAIHTGPAFPNSLSRGKRGAWVKRLQGLLFSGGFMTLDGNLDKDGWVDGVFGGSVEGAVKRAQQKAGLPMSGVVDRRLWLFLLGF